MSWGRGLLLVATIAAFGVTLRSVWIGPFPLWFAIIFLLIYITIALSGVMIPRLEMYADVVWHGPKSMPCVALTFDDGPHPVHTRRVLEILHEYNAVATFFVLGNKVEQYPEVVQQIVQQGHSIGVHGYDHDYMISLRSTKRIRQDMRKTIDAVRHATGITPVLYRPPVGQISPRIERAARDESLTIVGWSARGLDGLNYQKPKKVAARIARHIRPGAIVLLHDAHEKGDDIPAGVEAVDKILQMIDAQGLQTVDVHAFVDSVTTVES